VRKDLGARGRESILAGHSTYELEARVTVVAIEEQAKERTIRSMEAANHQDMINIRRHTRGLRLLHGWSTTRDRINRWMPHLLRTDEKQAYLHRSMLAEPNVKEEAWARLVLEHWYLYKAATGMELDILLSVRAVDSRDQLFSETADVFSCLELTVAESVRDRPNSHIL